MKPNKKLQFGVCVLVCAGFGLSGCGTGAAWTYPTSTGAPGGRSSATTGGSGPNAEIIGVNGPIGPVGPGQKAEGSEKPNYPGAGKYPSGPRGERGKTPEKPERKEVEATRSSVAWPVEELDKGSESEAEAVLDHKRRTIEEEPYFVEGIVIDSIEYAINDEDPSSGTKQSVLVRLGDEIQVRADAWKYLHVKVGDHVTLEVMQRHIEDVTKRRYIVYAKR